MSKLQLHKRNGLVSVLGLAGLVVGCVSGLLGYSGSAVATPPSGFSSATIGVATFDEIRIANAGEANVKIRTKGDVDVHTLVNTFAPGGTIGWHRHPGPSLVTVVAGTATLYDGDDPTCTPHVFPVGTGFVDAGDDVHIVRNEQNVDLVVVVVSIVPEGAPRRIDVPNPGNCPF